MIVKASCVKEGGADAQIVVGYLHKANPRCFLIEDRVVRIEKHRPETPYAPVDVEVIRLQKYHTAKSIVIVSYVL